MKTADLSLFDRFADIKKAEFSKRLHHKHIDLALVGAELRKTILMLREWKWKTHEGIWSPCLFLNTVYYDLSILVADLAFERHEWKRRFIARSLALLIFEIGEDIPSVFGKNFRNSCIAIGVSTCAIDQIGNSLKALNTFYIANQKVLKKIRTISSAHRDHDPILLNDTIEGLDLFELLGIGLEIGNKMHDLGAASGLIINESAACMPPEMKIS